MEYTVRQTVCLRNEQCCRHTCPASAPETINQTTHCNWGTFNVTTIYTKCWWYSTFSLDIKIQLSYCVKKMINVKTVLQFILVDADSSIFGYLILGVVIDTMQYQGRSDLFTRAHWAQKFGPFGTGTGFWYFRCWYRHCWIECYGA